MTAREGDKITPEQVHAMCAYLSPYRICAQCPNKVPSPYGEGEPGCYGIALETLEKAREILGTIPADGTEG